MCFGIGRYWRTERRSYCYGAVSKGVAVFRLIYRLCQFSLAPPGVVFNNSQFIHWWINGDWRSCAKSKGINCLLYTYAVTGFRPCRAVLYCVVPQSSDIFPADMRGWINAALMLGHRRRRWANIKTTLDQRLVSSGSWAEWLLFCNALFGSQRARHNVYTMLAYCWASIVHGRPTLNQNCVPGDDIGLYCVKLLLYWQWGDLKLH